MDYIDTFNSGSGRNVNVLDTFSLGHLSFGKLFYPWHLRRMLIFKKDVESLKNSKLM